MRDEKDSVVNVGTTEGFSLPHEVPIELELGIKLGCFSRVRSTVTR